MSKPAEQEKMELQETLTAWLGSDLEMMNIRLNSDQSKFILGSMAEMIELLYNHLHAIDEAKLEDALDNVIQLMRLNILQLSTSVYWRDKYKWSQNNSEG